MRRVLPFVLLMLLIAIPGCRTTETTEAEEAVPAGPVTGTVAAADGVAIAYTSDGAGDTALVLIHGWMCDQGYWSDQVSAFTDEYRVVAIDLPGHGLAGRDRTEWSIEGFGEDVRAVVEELGLEKVVLAGHSMGGPVALEAAARMPGKVAGIIGVDTLHDVEYEWNEEIERQIIDPLVEDFTAGCDAFVRAMIPPDADPALADRISSDMCATENAGIGVTLMKLFPGYSEKDALAAAGAPIRCINAPQFPTNVAGNRKYAPDFDVVMMEGVGHFVHMEQPAKFNEKMAVVLDELLP